MSLGKATNWMEVNWDTNGDIHVAFVPKTPEEYAASPEPYPTSQAPEPLHLNLSDEAKQDPHLRTMASECAIYGLASTMHIWGE